MLVLENGDTLRGDATNAAEVDYTIHGLDNNALKHLADGQLPATIGTLYAADSTDVITTIVLVNTGAGANTINLYHHPSGGTARRIIPKDLSLPSGYSLHMDGKRVQVLNTSGKLVFSYTAEPHASSHVDGDAIQEATASQKGLATAAQITKLNDIEAEADVTDAENVEDTITGAGAVTTPANANIFTLVVSGVLKKVTWTNIKVTLKTYFDTVYAAIAHASSHKSGGSAVLYVPHRYVWHFYGDCTVKTNEVIFRVGSQVETAFDVKMTVKDGNEPTGCSLIGDVCEDGTTIFTTPPEIDDGQEEEDGNHEFSDTSLAADAQITAKITQIGSTNPGKDLTMQLHVMEPVL